MGAGGSSWLWGGGGNVGNLDEQRLYSLSRGGLGTEGLMGTMAPGKGPRHRDKMVPSMKGPGGGHNAGGRSNARKVNHHGVHGHAFPLNAHGGRGAQYHGGAQMSQGHAAGSRPLVLWPPHSYKNAGGGGQLPSDQHAGGPSTYVMHRESLRSRGGGGDGIDRASLLNGEGNQSLSLMTHHRSHHLFQAGSDAGAFGFKR